MKITEILPLGWRSGDPANDTRAPAEQVRLSLAARNEAAISRWRHQAAPLHWPARVHGISAYARLLRCYRSWSRNHPEPKGAA